MRTGWIAAVSVCLALGAYAGGATAGPAPVPVEAFADSSLTGSPRLSPDGLHLAVSVELGEGHYALAIYRLQDMQRTAFLRMPRYELPADAYWVSDRRLVIAKGRQMGSREQPRATGEIIATDLDGSNQKYLYGYRETPRIAGLHRGYGAIEGLPAVRNGHFYMRRYSYNSNVSQLYDVDTGRGTARLVADIPVRNLSFTLDRNGVPRYAHGVDDDDRYLLYAAEAQGANWTRVPPEQMGGRFVPGALSADGRQVYGFLSVDDGPSVLVRANLDGSARHVVAEDGFRDVDDLEWASAPLQPFAANIGEGRPRTLYFDPDSEEATLHQALARGFPEHQVSYASHSADGSVRLLYAYSDRDPGAWFVFDSVKRKASRLLARREAIDPARMGERRPFRFRASDGMELDGYMTIPQGIVEPRQLPMVLLPHGGPHAAGDTWPYDNDAQFLASRGYLVLQVNYRGSQGRGRRFEEAGYLQWGTRIQDDLLDGVRWSIAQGHADPRRICAYGASFGAYSAMMVAARAPELIRCAAGLSGLYDLKMMYSKGDITSSKSGRNYLARVVGRDDAALAAGSPTAQAASIKAPVLLVHGEVDERTPLAQATAMKAALERAGNAPEWMVVPKEGHGFYKDENNIAFYCRLEAFLDRHIGGAAAQ